MQQEEMVDVVDADGNVLSQVLKSEAHTKGLLHKTVISQIHNSKDEWVLVKQTSDRQDAGQFVSPVGGHVIAGESDEAALRREALEEAGISSFDCKLVGKFIYRREVLGRNENHLFVIYRIESDGPFVAGAEVEFFEAYTVERLKYELKSKPEKFGLPFVAIIQNFYPEILL
jgi:8-oxo-dGTP pyrophosphatase MutT (NUDIX family)